MKVSLVGNEPFVKIGHDIILQCTAFDFNPNDPYTIKWYYNDGREMGSANVNGRNLILRNVNPVRDEGTYSCQVTDSSGTTSDALFLPIQCNLVFILNYFMIISVFIIYLAIYLILKDSSFYSDSVGGGFEPRLSRT